MRRISALLLAFLLALTLAAPAFAVTTIPVKAFVKENFENATSNIPCDVDEAADTLTCFGRGNAGRFGPLNSVVVFTEDSITRTITLRDGSTITLDEEYFDFSTPGKSGDAPGTFQSFGNPTRAKGTFEVIGGTGGLAGAEGSGTIKQNLNGNTIQIWFTGTITLP